MKTIPYPRLDADPASAFTQDAFNRAHAQLMSWRQSAGAFGDLHLHACWGDSSVMSRRYHGQTIHQSSGRMKGFMRLFERTGELRWKLLVDDILSNILFLQTPGGGFYHASSEYEPTYRAEQTCPILQGIPLLGLLDYAVWPHGDPARKSVIREAIDRHWRWFEKLFWKRGNAWKQGLDYPAFCGVTNQDLVIVAALANYAVVHGDDSAFQRCGKPTLDTYLSPRYYHERLGLFERGDRPNFAERTVYYDVIIPMLRIIDQAIPDPRIQPVIDNVTRSLFAAAYTAGDGLVHLSYGAETFEDDKRQIKDWIREPRNVASYPGQIHAMTHLLAHEPNEKNRAICRGLERTVAAYTFSDGNLPLAVGGEPLFAVASRADTFWWALIERLGDRLQSPAELSLPTILRTRGDIEFKSNAHAWAIFKNEKRMFAGLKCNPSAIAIGPDEQIAGADFALLEDCDIQETLDCSPTK
jgi:hypothetical protein